MFDFRWLRDYSDYFYLGLLFPSSIVVGTVMGYFADRWLNSDPWGKIIGFFFGVVAGGISFYRDYQKITKKNESKKR